MRSAACNSVTEDSPCSGPVAYRGPSGWQCEGHWLDTRTHVDSIKKKAERERRRRLPKDTEP